MFWFVILATILIYLLETRIMSHIRGSSSKAKSSSVKRGSSKMVKEVEIVDKVPCERERAKLMNLLNEYLDKMEKDPKSLLFAINHFSDIITTENDILMGEKLDSIVSRLLAEAQDIDRFDYEIKIHNAQIIIFASTVGCHAFSLYIHDLYADDSKAKLVCDYRHDDGIMVDDSIELNLEVIYQAISDFEEREEEIDTVQSMMRKDPSFFEKVLKLRKETRDEKRKLKKKQVEAEQEWNNNEPDEKDLIHADEVIGKMSERIIDEEPHEEE